MYGTLHMQRYDQLHAEETATQRVKGQRDDPEESAMDRGRERPFRTHSPTDARAVGGETGDVNEGTAMPPVIIESHRGTLCRSTAS